MMKAIRKSLTCSPNGKLWIFIEIEYIPLVLLGRHWNKMKFKFFYLCFKIARINSGKQRDKTTDDLGFKWKIPLRFGLCLCIPPSLKISEAPSVMSRPLKMLVHGLYYNGISSYLKEIHKIVGLGLGWGGGRKRREVIWFLNLMLIWR